jgi:hypothetical protein
MVCSGRVGKDSMDADRSLLAADFGSRRIKNTGLVIAKHGGAGRGVIYGSRG